MENTIKNQFVFKGEVAELLDNQLSVKTLVTCKPGTLIIEVPTTEEYQLGDELIVTGNFVCEKIENIVNFNTNH